MCAPLLALAALVGCLQLDPRVRYLCEGDGSCFQPGHVCQSDGYCRPADAGDPTGCVRLTSCPAGVECGRVDAGCGVELLCGRCTAPLECGAREAHRCGLPNLCGRDGWCTESPLPQGNTIRAGWAADERNVYWVGDDATILYWDGERHRLVTVPSAVPSGTSFRAVHGTSARDVYVVGSLGTILHFDGDDWLIEAIEGGSTSELLAVYARGPRDAVAAGEGGTVLRRQVVGNGWTQVGLTSIAQPMVVVGVGAGGLFRAISATGAIYGEDSPGGAWSAGGSLGVAPRAAWRAPEGPLHVVGWGDRSLDGGPLVRGSWLVREASDGGAAWQTLVGLPFEGVALAGVSGAELYVAGADGALAAVASGQLRLPSSGGTASPARAAAALGAVVVLDGGVWAQGDRGLIVTAPRGAPVERLEPLSSGGASVLSGLCAQSEATLTAVSLAPSGCASGACEALAMVRRSTTQGPRWEAIARPVASDTARWAFSACHVREGSRVLVGDGSSVHASFAGGAFEAIAVVDASGGELRNHRAAWWFQAAERYVLPARAFGSWAPITWADGQLGQARTTFVPMGAGGRLRALGGTAERAFVGGSNGLLVELFPDGGTSALVLPSISENFAALAAEALPQGRVRLIAAGEDGLLVRLVAGEESAAQATRFPSHVWNAVWAGADGAAWAGGYEWVDLAPIDGGSRVRVARAVPDGGFVGVPAERAGRVSGVWADVRPDGGVWIVTDRGAILRRDGSP